MMRQTLDIGTKYFIYDSGRESLGEPELNILPSSDLIEIHPNAFGRNPIDIKETLIITSGVGRTGSV
jgi:hypothetical protein